VSAFGGGWGRRIWRVGCWFWAGLAGPVWRRAAARIPKGAGQNGCVWWLPFGGVEGGDRREVDSPPPPFGGVRWRHLPVAVKMQRAPNALAAGGHPVPRQPIAALLIEKGLRRAAAGSGVRLEGQSGHRFGTRLPDRWFPLNAMSSLLSGLDDSSPLTSTVVLRDKRTQRFCRSAPGRRTGSLPLLTFGTACAALDDFQD
jgi:hypothetical protein